MKLKLCFEYSFLLKSMHHRSLPFISIPPQENKKSQEQTYLLLTLLQRTDRFPVRLNTQVEMPLSHDPNWSPYRYSGEGYKRPPRSSHCVGDEPQRHLSRHWSVLQTSPWEYRYRHKHVAPHASARPLVDASSYHSWCCDTMTRWRDSHEMRNEMRTSRQ